jgi:hypothetical protein
VPWRAAVTQCVPAGVLEMRFPTGAIEVKF